MENKNIFLKNYGVYYSIPSIYILDANIFAKNPRYVFQLVKYVMPSEEVLAGHHNDSYQVQSHQIDGSSHIKTYGNLFESYNDSVVLRVLTREGNYIQQVFDSYDP